MKQGIVVTQAYLVLSTYNFTNVMIVPARPHPCSNLDISQHFFLAGGNDTQKDLFLLWTMSESNVASVERIITGIFAL